MSKEDITALKWRLKDRPTVENMTDLVEAGILTKEEARQIILDKVEVDPVTLEDLQNEIKLLRKMVLELSENRPQPIIKIIEKEIERWPKQPYWFNDYNTVYCSLSSDITSGTGTTTLTTSGNTITGTLSN